MRQGLTWNPFFIPGYTTRRTINYYHRGLKNYPGYANGIQGPEMMVGFWKTSSPHGYWYPFMVLLQKLISLLNLNKVQIDERKMDWSGFCYHCYRCISKMAGVLKVKERFKWFMVVSACCSMWWIFSFVEKEVAIVGAGDTAAERSLVSFKTLYNGSYADPQGCDGAPAKWCRTVFFNTPNINVYWNTDTEEIIGDKTVHAVRIKNNKNRCHRRYTSKGFLCCHWTINLNSDIFKGWLDMDEAGYIKTIPGTFPERNIEGVFASGDVPG